MPQNTFELDRVRYFTLIIVISLLGTMGSCGMYAIYYTWDAGTNHGYISGYYGEYNTVLYALQGMPGVTVIDSGFNHDVTLEEMGFDLRLKDGTELSIAFSETDPVRTYTGEQLISGLQTKIADERQRLIEREHGDTSP